jgi:cytochrome b
MNVRSASPAEARADESAPPSPGRVLVWDAPVRVFHWLMVLSFAGAYVTAESERWRLLHVTLGYTLAGLVVFRLVWGLPARGTRASATSCAGRRRCWRYLRGLVAARPSTMSATTRPGRWPSWLLLGLALGVTASGFAALQRPQPASGSKEVHEAAANIMLAVVLVHVAGVAVSSWLHRENLVRRDDHRPQAARRKTASAVPGAAWPR